MKGKKLKGRKPTEQEKAAFKRDVERLSSESPYVPTMTSLGGIIPFDNPGYLYTWQKPDED